MQRLLYVSVLACGANSAQWNGAQRKVPIMPDQDLPPEFRQHHYIPPVAIPIELPLDDERPAPVRKPDSDSPEQRNPEPFLRRS
jgi:hypothetical protein